MPDVVARYTIERKFAPNPSNGKGRCLVDAKITLYPADAFVATQIASNAHHAKIESAGRTNTGEVVLEPKSDSSKPFKAYLDQRQKWLSANALELLPPEQQ